MAVADSEDPIRTGFLQEDPKAIGEVRRWILGVARRNWGLRDTDAAVQDALLKLVRMARCGRIRGDTRFRAFVVHVARLTCIDAFRRQSLAEQRATEYAEERAVHGGGARDTAFGSAELHDLAQFILQAISPPCRRLLRWVLGEDRPYAWVARQLDIQPGAARVRAHRCLEAARKIGRRHGYPVRRGVDS